jgi:hypothetical protein
MRILPSRAETGDTWLVRWAVAITLATGCYAPTTPSNVPCGDGDACPSGQMCIENLCTSMPAAGPDGPPATDDAPTTRIDASDDAPSNPASLRFGDGGNGAIPDTFFETFLGVGTDEPLNFGAHADLHLMSGEEQPVLIRVDVSAIPPSATITAARLELRITDEDIPAGRDIDVFVLNESWTEGNRDGNDGIANHTHRNANQEWAEHGAVPPSRAATAIVTKEVETTLNTGDLLVIELPPALVTSWVASPNTNFGIALIDDATGFYCELGSSEGSLDVRPALVVDLQ